MLRPRRPSRNSIDLFWLSTATIAALTSLPLFALDFRLLGAVLLSYASAAVILSLALHLLQYENRPGSRAVHYDLNSLLFPDQPTPPDQAAPTVCVRLFSRQQPPAPPGRHTTDLGQTTCKPCRRPAPALLRVKARCQRRWDILEASQEN